MLIEVIVQFQGMSKLNFPKTKFSKKQKVLTQNGQLCIMEVLKETLLAYLGMDKYYKNKITPKVVSNC